MTLACFYSRGNRFESEAKKKMCVYYCIEKLNRVDRSENGFILLKVLYGDNIAKQGIPC